MKNSITRTKKFSSIVGKIVIALIFASMIGGLPVVWASERHADRRERYREHRQYEHNRRVYHRNYGYQRRPVFVPPPVVYDPYEYQSPGITLFFPIPFQ